VTVGEGNDTEAVWSPDGARIAFQRERAGNIDVAVVDVASGAVTTLVAGAGNACYPAWAPNGALVYVYGYHPLTASQASAKNANGYNLRLWDGGETRALTAGYWRDYTPSVSPDGAAVFYASTQGITENGASLWRLPLAGGGAAKCVLRLDGASVGAVSPSLSPDGRFLLWAQLDGFRGNWRLWAARAEEPLAAVPLTPETMSAYAPRWSPDGKFVAFTGFREGDAGWGLYVMEPRSGVMARLDALKGNSRSPAWSPNGRELVFENNRSGVYKLFRMRLKCRVEGVLPPSSPAEMEKTARIEAEWVCEGGGASALACADGSRIAGRAVGGGALAFDKPPGLNFGAGPFFISVRFTVDALPNDTRIVAMGRYAEHALGWQIFVRETGKIGFNARDPKGTFIGVSSDRPLRVKQSTDVLGIRDADGSLRLYVNGVAQAQRASGATMAYGPALQVCLGQQWNGGMRLEGRIEAFKCGRGYPAGVPRRLTREALFGEAAL